MNPTRRAVTLLLVSAPAAALALGDEDKKKDPPPEAEFFAAHEPGLTDAERARVKRAVAEGQPALDAIRGFKLPADVAPALRFQAMKSPAKTAGR